MLLVLFCPPPTAPPFVAGFGAPLGRTVNDGLRVWSTLLPLTMVGPPTEGTAGMVGFLPFTGEMVSAGGRPPAAADMFEGSDAFGGKPPLVADAYEERPDVDTGAGKVGAGADEEFGACTAGERALVVSARPIVFVCWGVDVISWVSKVAILEMTGVCSCEDRKSVV